MERSNEQWTEELRSQGAARDIAIRDLRNILVGGLRRALAGWRRGVGREFHELAEDFAQEALVKILSSLDSFRGLSRFTTWAHKVAIRIALTELRRRRWQDVSLDAAMEKAEVPALMEGDQPDADVGLQQTTLLAAIRTAMMRELTERQRMAVAAVALAGLPMEEAARRMGTNRNALYRLMHDARRKLKSALESQGIAVEEIMERKGRGKMPHRDRIHDGGNP